MPSFEEKLFGNQANRRWRVRFAGSRPDFDADIRKILEDPNLPRCPEEPEAYLGRVMYSHLQKSMRSLGLPTEHLLWFSCVGTKADLFYETDGAVFTWINDRPILISLDAFNFGGKNFEKLKSYWIDVSQESSYHWRDLQNDLFRFKRIFAEKRNQLVAFGYSDKDALYVINNWWLLSLDFKNLWESGYRAKVPDYFIERPIGRPLNHVIITPTQVKSRGDRRFLAKMLANYILEVVEQSTTST